MARLTKEEQKIKKKFGDEMWRLCQELKLTGLTAQINYFNDLNKEHELYDLLDASFAPSKTLIEILCSDKNKKLFEEFVYTRAGEKGFKLSEEKQEAESSEKIGTKEYTEEDIIKMFDEAGYVLFPECKTEADVQFFRQYYDRLGRGNTPEYKEGETPEQYVGDELCTFNGGRLKDRRIWFAMKKEVYENKFAIPRQPVPLRDDIYGTSVISIQWTKGKSSSLSIMNRYNHNITDSNPDRTLDNDLEKIHSGLTAAFRSVFGIKVIYDQKDLNLPEFIQDETGKYHIEIDEHNGVRFCADNSIIYPDGSCKSLDKNDFIVIDGYVIYKQKRLIIESFTEKDDIKKGDKQQLKKVTDTQNKETGERIVTLEYPNGDIINLTLNKRNQVIKLASPNMIVMQDRFFCFSKNIQEIDFPELEKMGNKCFEWTRIRGKLSLLKLKIMGDECFGHCECEEVEAQKLERIGKDAFDFVNNVKKLIMPNLIQMGQSCFSSTVNLKKIYMPKLKIMEDFCFGGCEEVVDVNFQSLEEMGNGCFCIITALKQLILPKLKFMGNECFEEVKSLEHIELPSLQTMGTACFYAIYNRWHSLKYIDLSSLQKMGDACFCCCRSITHLNLPSLLEISDSCFYKSPLVSVYAPNLMKGNPNDKVFELAKSYNYSETISKLPVTQNAISDEEK